MTETHPETLWGGYEDEELRHETADEAIEAIIDDWDPTDDKTISVWEYKRRELPSVEDLRDSLMDWLRDDLDPEYGDPDQSTDFPTEVVIAAERFAQVVRREWPVWTMERSENKIEANVGEWKRVNS
jgi:hypothetical protein